MAEWSNAAVLKTVVPSREPGVRIPLSPPGENAEDFLIFCFIFRRDAGVVERGAVSKTVVLLSRNRGFESPLSPQKNLRKITALVWLFFFEGTGSGKSLLFQWERDTQKEMPPGIFS
jgi:hypothetical protein